MQSREIHLSATGQTRQVVVQRLASKTVGFNSVSTEAHLPLIQLQLQYKFFLLLLFCFIFQQMTSICLTSGHHCKKLH